MWVSNKASLHGLFTYDFIFCCGFRETRIEYKRITGEVLLLAIFFWDFFRQSTVVGQLFKHILYYSRITTRPRKSRRKLRFSIFEQQFWPTTVL